MSENYVILLCLLQGFGVSAKSTQDCRHADPMAVVCFHQADIGQYIRSEDTLMSGWDDSQTRTSSHYTRWCTLSEVSSKTQTVTSVLFQYLSMRSQRTALYVIKDNTDLYRLLHNLFFSSKCRSWCQSQQFNNEKGRSTCPLKLTTIGLPAFETASTYE